MPTSRNPLKGLAILQHLFKSANSGQIAARQRNGNDYNFEHALFLFSHRSFVNNMKWHCNKLLTEAL